VIGYDSTRSWSPWMISTGTSMPGRSGRKSVNQAGMQAAVPNGDAIIAIVQCACIASWLTRLPRFWSGLKKLFVNSVMNAGRSFIVLCTNPSNMALSKPSGLSAVFIRNGGIGEMSTARLTRSEPYALRYRVTSPVPMECPTRVMSLSSSAMMSFARSPAKVS
jgi:hypothetical protein